MTVSMEVAYHSYVSFSSLFDSTRNGLFSGRASCQACAHSIRSHLPIFGHRQKYVARKSKGSARNLKHKLSDHLRGNLAGTSAWAITPLRISPPTFIKFSSVLTFTHGLDIHSREKRYQALPSVAQEVALRDDVNVTMTM